MASFVLVPVSAFAGTYTVTQTTSSDLTGWAFSGSPGFIGCSTQLTSGACSGVAAPSALYALGSGAASAGGTGVWTWTAPAGLSVSSGSVSVYWSIAAKNTTAWLKTQAAGQSFGTQPRVNEAGGSSSPTWSIPSGTQAFQVGLGASAAVSYPSGLSNLVKISKLQVTLQDTTNPTVGAISIPGVTGGTYNPASGPLCVPVSASDTGSGVTEVDIKNASGTVLASYKPAAQSAFQPGAASISQNVCVPVAKLPQGANQTMHVVATDGAGNSTDVPFTLSIGAPGTLGPQVVTTTPTGLTTAQPYIAMVLNVGEDNLASASATLDGSQSFSVNSFPSTTSLVLNPSSPLSVGRHTVTWTATDDAGNTSTGSWSFSVGTGPVVTATGGLVGGNVVGSANTCTMVTVTDDVAGIAEVDLYYDSGKFLSSFKGPQTPGATVSKNVCITPSAMGNGPHTLLISGTDAYGNKFSKTYAFSVSPTVLVSGIPSGPIDPFAVLRFTFDGGPSGITSSYIEVDNSVIQNGDVNIAWAVDGLLSYGTHSVRWSATNGAGQTGGGTFILTVEPSS